MSGRTSSKGHLDSKAKTLATLPPSSPKLPRMPPKVERGSDQEEAGFDRWPQRRGPG